VVQKEFDSSLELIVFRSDHIKSLLKKLKAKTSSGPDGLPPIVFKNLANYLSGPLAKFYNMLMLKETIPNLWKQANVTPIFKKVLRLAQKITDPSL
jgi:hypothetical protein